MPASPAPRRELTIQRLIQKFGRQFLKTRPNLADYKQAALKDIAACRTGALGSHWQYCSSLCGYEVERPNSCRHRHCPACGGPRKAKWLEKLLARSLPVDHMQVVFTLPHQLIPIVQKFPQELYDLLFDTAWATLKALSADPTHLGATVGATAVLHTWNQVMQPHPHVHFVLPAGGISLDGERWNPCKRLQGKAGKPGGYYLFPHKVISKLFRGKFLAGLKELILSGKIPLEKLPPSWQTLAQVRQHLSELYAIKWVVHQQSPPPGLEPEAMFKYLARYVQGSAIGDARLVSLDGDLISFTFKNRKTGHREVCTLPVPEFLSRYVLHVLPPGLKRVRYYGFMASASGRQRERAKELLGISTTPSPAEVCVAAEGSASGVSTAPDSVPDSPGSDPAESEVIPQAPNCPHCKRGLLVLSPEIRETSRRVRREPLVTGPYRRFRDGPVIYIPDVPDPAECLSPSSPGPPGAVPPGDYTQPLRQRVLPFADLDDSPSVSDWGYYLW